MATPRRLAPLALLALFAAASCDGPTGPATSGDESAPENWPPSLSVVPSVPAVCGDPTQVGLMLGPDIPSGTVEVTNDESNLYVVFHSDAGRSILASAVFVGDSPDEIPTTRRGLPRLLQFPYKSGHRWGTMEVVWEIPLSDVSGEDAVIAAFAQVGLLPSWGEGEPISPDRDWAMYFHHRVATCGAATVDEEGGTVSTPDAGATLSIPAGALAGPVDITIEPATVEDLLEHAGGLGEPSAAASAAELDGSGSASNAAAVDGALQTVFGVTPVESTIWELGPDGLQFLTPATIVLHYDESDLPPDVAEEDLGAFVINGIFERLPATVDTDANTLTAEIGHFSLVFIGVPPVEVPDLVDLAVTGLGVSGPLTAGVTLTFQAAVSNLGPAVTHGGTLTYQAEGDVTLADLSVSCEEVSSEGPGVAVSCALPPLDVGASEETSVPSLRIVPHSMGDVTVTATVAAAEGDVDGNADNDQVQRVVSIGEADGADLEMTGIPIHKHDNAYDILDDPSEYRVGAYLDFTAAIRNNGPYASGEGTLVYHTLGDVQVQILTSRCAEIPTIYDVSISCDFAGVLPGAEALAVPPFILIPQSVGNVTVWATVAQGPQGRIDPDPDNNEQSRTVDVLEGQVDLAPRMLVFGDATVAQNDFLQIFTLVQRLGPDLAIGGTLTLSFVGTVELVGVGADCMEVPDPADADLAVECDLNHSGDFEVTVSPRVQGPLIVSSTTAPAEGQTDPNPDNDTDTLVFSIVPANGSGG